MLEALSDMKYASIGNFLSLAAENLSTWVILSSSDRTGGTARLPFSQQFTSIAIFGNEACILFKWHSPSACTSAVIVSAGVATFPFIPARPIRCAPLAGDTDPLDGYLDVSSSAHIRLALGGLVGNATRVALDAYLRAEFVDILFHYRKYVG